MQVNDINRFPVHTSFFAYGNPQEALDGRMKDFRAGEILAFAGEATPEIIRLAGIAGGLVYAGKELSNELELILEKRGIPVIAGAESFDGYEDGEHVVLDANRGILYRVKK